MLPDPKKDALDLYLAANQLLTRSSAASNASSYIPVLPNTYALYVQRPSEANAAPIKTPTLHAEDGSFFTILATSQNGQITLEVIDDTIDPKTDDGTVRLVIRQYYPGTRAVVTVGTMQPVTLNYGETNILDHLPTGTIPITIQATLPGVPPKAMGLSANYTAHHHGTLFVVGDLYGRLRPFLTVDGYSDLNLAKVMEHWLQTSAGSPILLPSSATPVVNASSDPSAQPKKSRKKARTTHRRKTHKHSSSDDDGPGAASGDAH